jgi:FkbM family methyltransferase
MNESGNTQSVLQALLVRMYGALKVDALRRSRVGDWLFERAYLAYKVLIEAGPINTLSRYVRPDSWVIDVGANIGVFTLPFARFVRGGRVIALEPEAANFAALERRVRSNRVEPLVQLHRAVAAERAGTLYLAVNPTHPGDHKIAEIGEPVPAVTLDRLIEDAGEPAVSLIKIDVQGAELRVLQGAERTIARSRPALLIEVDEKALQQQGASIRQLADWLSARSYRPHRFTRSQPPEPLENEQRLQLEGYADVLFLFTAHSGTG